MAYNYSLSTDFNGQIDITLLESEIRASVIKTNLQSIVLDADDVYIYFDTTLSVYDISILDSVVANHTGNNLAITGTVDEVNITNINMTDSGDAGIEWIRYQGNVDDGSGFVKNNKPMQSGIIQSTGPTAITLEPTALDVQIGMWVSIDSGVGVGQIRRVVFYDPAIKEITIETPWTTTPSGTYSIHDKLVCGMYFDETDKKFKFAYLQEQQTDVYQKVASLANVQADIIEATNIIGLVNGRDNVNDGIILDNHVTDLNNPHGVTKQQIGLGNVMNVKVNLSATAPPANEIGYGPGSIWIYNSDIYLYSDSWKLINGPSLGEANDGINLGNGIGLFVNKLYSTLQFKSLTSNNTIKLVDNGNEIDISVGIVDHNTLSNKGLYTHDVIDLKLDNASLHANNTNNPHTVTKAQIGLDNVMNIKNTNQTVNPNTTDDSTKGYSIGSKWVNTLSNDVWICTRSNVNDANWSLLTEKNSIVGTGLSLLKTTTSQLSTTTATSIHKSLIAGYGIVLTDGDDITITLDNVIDSGVYSHSDIDNHINSIINPHQVTKAQIGLSNVQNIKNTIGNRAPTILDGAINGYSVGSTWIYNSDVWKCVDNTNDASVWIKLTQEIINVGTGIQLASGMTMKTLTSPNIIITDNGQTVNFDVSLSHTQLSDIGTYTHSQLDQLIDNHLANLSNPHQVTKAQIGLSNVLNTKNKITITSPTITNSKLEGYDIGSTWFDTINKRVYVCLDNTVDASVWKELTLSSSSIGTSLLNNNTLKSITSSSLTITNTAETVNIEVDKIIVDHTQLTNIGKYTHNQLDQLIDTHLANLSNPHQVTKAQIGLSNVQNIKNSISTTNPTTLDDINKGYSVGSHWYTGTNIFICLDNTIGSAVWFDVGSGSGSGTALGSNIGSGIGLYYNTTTTMNFKTLVGSNVTITDNVDTVTLSVDLTPFTNHINNTSNPHSVTLNQISPCTTKNDLIVFNGTDHVRLGGGLDNQVLGITNGTIQWQPEINATSIGTGISVYDSKVNSVFQFKSIKAINSKILITQNAGDIQIGINSSAINHSELSGSGVYTHAQIDNHINASNPHGITKADVGLSLVQNIKQNLIATTNPTSNDNILLGYTIGSRWINTVSGEIFTCIKDGVWISNTITATNNGSGISLFTNTNNNNIQLKSINVNGLLISEQNQTITIGLDVIDHNILSNIGNYTHSQIDQILDSHLSAINPHSITKDQIGLSNVQNIKNNTTNTNPTYLDDSSKGYTIGSHWLNTFSDEAFICIDDTVNASVWKPVINTTPGEINTASNVGIGLGLYYGKVGSDLQFRSLKANSPAVNLIDDITGKRILLDINQGGIDHTLLQNTGTYTHAQIDSHISNTSNPHNVTFNDVSPFTSIGQLLTFDGTNSIILQPGLTGQVLSFNNGLQWITPTYEVNDGSNAGTSGVGVYVGKVGATLQFKNFIGDGVLNVLDNTLENRIDLSINQSSIDHTLLQNTGTYTHTQIDNHINNTSNPHNVTYDSIKVTSTKGDITVDNGINSIRLPIGTIGQVLTVSNSLPAWQTLSVGEINTISNVGVSGVGIYKNKVNEVLNLYKLNGDNTISIVYDPIIDAIKIGVIEQSVNHNNLSNVGTYTHTQIDTMLNDAITHQSNTNNPHSVTINQISPLTALGDLMVHDGTGVVKLSMGTPNQHLLATPTGIQWSNVDYINNGSNLGTGFNVFSGKVGSVLQFNSITSGSNKIVTSLSASNILIDVDSTNIDHDSLLNSGTYTHAQLDAGMAQFISHLADTTNPHSVTIDQLSPATIKGQILVYNGLNTIGFNSGADLSFLVSDSTASSGLRWANISEASVTSMENVGTGVGIWKQKNNTTHQLYKLSSSNKLSIQVSTQIDLDVVESNINHDLLLNSGTYTHAQLDAGMAQFIDHLASSNNPHSVTMNQISPGITKGDIIVFDGTNNVSLSVGASGYVLSSNSLTSTGLTWTNPSTLFNGANTGTSGYGLYKNKTSNTLNFKNIANNDGFITVTTDPNHVFLNFNNNINHSDLNGVSASSRTHAQIDLLLNDFVAHKSNTNNPHAVTLEQISPCTTQGDLIVFDGVKHIAINTTLSSAMLVNGTNGVEWKQYNLTNGRMLRANNNIIESSELIVSYTSGLMSCYPYVTNTNMFIGPTGTGSFMIQNFANSLTNIGVNAVDLQLSRSNSGQCSSGMYSFTAGRNNTASGIGSIALGFNAVANGDNSFVFNGSGVANGAVSAGSFNVIGVSNLQNVNMSGQLSVNTINAGSLTVNHTGEFIISSDPISALGVATKQYVDSIATGITPKQSVITKTTAPLPAYTRTLNDITGTGPIGSIGGIAVAIGQRVLIDSSGTVTDVDNGIYVVQTLDPFKLSRSNDNLQVGISVFVESGNVAGDVYVLSNSGSVNVDPIIFTLFSTPIDLSFINTGTGAKVYKETLGSNVYLKSISTTSLNIVENLDTIDINLGVIDHNNLINNGTYNHAQIDSHINQTNIHFTEASIQHSNIVGAGTYTHAQIDNHINNVANPHSITLNQITPTTTVGDILVHTTTGIDRFGIGLQDQVLVVNNNQLQWQYHITNATNIGTGVGIFSQLNGQNLEFFSIIGSNKLSVTKSISNISIDVVEQFIDHDLLLNSGTYTHSQIDSLLTNASNHISNVANPHSVTLDQIKPTTTRGDLIVETGNNSTRLAVGSDGMFLTSDSTSTSGLKWSYYTFVGSNVGTKGVGVYSGQRNFRNISGTTKLSVTLNIDDIELDVNEININHDNLANTGTYTHTQIDSLLNNANNHISNVANPHSVTLDQITPMTTKGDIVVYNGTNTVRLPVGTNGMMLTVDNTSPEGIKWATYNGITDGVNIGSNGVGVFDSVVFDSVVSNGGVANSGKLQFRNISSTTNAITVNLLNNEVQLTLNETYINSIIDSGTYTHVQIDNHINRTDNPHSITLNQITPTTTKGDLLVHGANIERLAVGVNNSVLVADNTTPLGITWKTLTVGEVNDGTNIGTGVSIYDSKVGQTLQFRTIKALGPTLIGLNGSNIEFNINPALLDHDLLLNSGTYTHVQIDSAINNANNHINRTDNPHSVTYNQLKPTTTKGDIVVDDGVSGVRLPAGQDGYVLTTKTSASTGVSWEPIPDNGLKNYSYWQRLKSFTHDHDKEKQFINKTLTKPNGTYKINYSYGWNADTTSSDFMCYIRVNGNEMVKHVQEAKDSGGKSDPPGSGSNQRHRISGFFMYEVTNNTFNVVVSTKSSKKEKSITIFDLRMDMFSVNNVILVDEPLAD